VPTKGLTCFNPNSGFTTKEENSDCSKQKPGENDMTNSQQVARASCMMKRSFQPGMAAVVLSVAVLLAFVPASGGLIIHTGSGTRNHPPITTVANEDVEAFDSTKVNLLTGGSIVDRLKADGNITVTVSGGHDWGRSGGR